MRKDKRRDLNQQLPEEEGRGWVPPSPVLSNLWPRKKPLGRAQHTARRHEVTVPEELQCRLPNCQDASPEPAGSMSLGGLTDTQTS